MRPTLGSDLRLVAFEAPSEGSPATANLRGRPIWMQANAWLVEQGHTFDVVDFAIGELTPGRKCLLFLIELHTPGVIDERQEGTAALTETVGSDAASAVKLEGFPLAEPVSATLAGG